MSPEELAELQKRWNSPEFRAEFEKNLSELDEKLKPINCYLDNL